MTCDRFEAEALEQLERGQPLEPHFAECPDCRERAREYDALKVHLGHLALQPMTAGAATAWQARVWAQIRQKEAAPRRWAWLGGAGALAAAAALAVVAWPHGQGVPRLEIQVRQGASEVVRGMTARPGDVLHVRGAPAGSQQVELRLYRDQVLVMTCSNTPPCVRSGDALEADVPLQDTGRYEAVMLVSDRPLVPSRPGAGADQPAMSDDLNAAVSAGAKVLTTTAVDVF